MELEHKELEGSIQLLKLIGDLDIMGVNSIDIKFTGYCSGESVRVLVDLSGVNYLASIGIRLLTSNAKSLASRNGKMVLFGAIPAVREVLEMTGISSIIPMYEKFESAQAVLLG